VTGDSAAGDRFWGEEFGRREAELRRVALTVRTEAVAGPGDLPKELRLNASDRLATYYALFDAVAHEGAKFLVAGLMPGFSQTVLSLSCQQRAGGDGPLFMELLTREVAFAGPMRSCLVRYLDEVGVHAALGVPTVGELFGSASGQLATCSLIRYPVFTLPDLKNYSGSPAGMQDPFIASMVWPSFDRLSSR
jgi:hypothetical protein